MIPDPRFEGPEVGWLAVDRREFVAILLTAGGELALPCFEPALEDGAVDGLAAGEAPLDVVYAAVLAGGRRSLLLELAEGGPHGFHVPPTGGPCRGGAIPSHPALSKRSLRS